MTLCPVGGLGCITEQWGGVPDLGSRQGWRRGSWQGVTVTTGALGREKEKRRAPPARGCRHPLPALGKASGPDKGSVAGGAGQRLSLIQPAWPDPGSGTGAGERCGEDWGGKSRFILQPQHLVKRGDGRRECWAGCRGEPQGLATSGLPGMGWMRPFPATPLAEHFSGSKHCRNAILGATGTPILIPAWAHP